MHFLNIFFPTKSIRDEYISKLFKVKEIVYTKNFLHCPVEGIQSIQFKSQYKKNPGYWVHIKSMNKTLLDDISSAVPQFWLEANLFFPKKVTNKRRMENLWVQKYHLKREPYDSIAWNIFYKEVQIHLKEGNIDVASVGLLYIYRNNPYFLKRYKRYYLFEDLAYYYQAKGEIHKSIRFLKIQASLQPGSLEPYLNMSSFLLMSGLNEEAIEVSIKGLQINPNNQYLSSNLLIGYFNEGYFDIALEYLKKLINKNPDVSTIWSIMGEVFYELGNDRQAILCYQKAIKINSKDIHEIKEDIYYGLGICYQQLGEWKKAIKYFRKLLQCNCTDPAILLNLSKLYGEDLKEYDQAEYYAQEMVRLFPQNGYGHHNLGLIYLYTDRLERAKWHLYKARRLIPDYQPVYHAISELKKARKNDIAYKKS